MATEDPAATPPPAWPSTLPPTQPSVTPTPTYDDTPVTRQLDDLNLQESVATQILAVLDDAGRAISAGHPDWIDGDAFGGTHQGERMARHTARAEYRVYKTLDMTLEALAQQYNALSSFRGEVVRVEAEGADKLAALKARLGEVAP